MLTGYLGSCNLNLAGDQSSTSIWDSCLNRGFYTLAYRRCTCFCTFCYANFSQQAAFNKCNTTPFYNTNGGNSGGNLQNSSFTLGAYNDGHPFMWNLIPNKTSGFGTVTISVTSPRSISKSTPIYGYELSQFSNKSSIITMEAILNGLGGGFFGGWRVNSAGGTLASFNFSFSPSYNTSYGKGGAEHYRNIYQFYANGSF